MRKVMASTTTSYTCGVIGVTDKLDVRVPLTLSFVAQTECPLLMAHHGLRRVAIFMVAIGLGADKGRSWGRMAPQRLTDTIEKGLALIGERRFRQLEILDGGGLP
jgi:hypothetical protein